ncbi:uncharacterized protein LOC131036794 [Cryptomeria japonica]|uniref:uncharacterized protein LOC131036794 n=1 Tax=Cryptomeria japonica TaxID=3369 RepID=UPI0027DA4E3F|nr:uncharacterized protein LOC131036794 [Cryptomeria japonica]
MKEEDMVKPKKSKPISTPPKQFKPRQSQFAPTSGIQKPIPPPKPQAKSTGGVEKRKKEKPQRDYIAETIEDIETKSDEAVKERYDVNLADDDTQPKEKSQAKFIPKVHATILDKKKDQSSKKTMLAGKSNDQTIVADDPYNANADNSSEAIQDPPMIKCVSDKENEEKVDAEKGEDDVEKDEKDASEEVVGKDKGEEDDQASMIGARDTVAVKGK